MILYHAITAYQLLNCIVHKLYFYPKTPATLLLPEFIINKYPSYDFLKNEAIFQEIFLVSHSIRWDLKTIEVASNKLFDELLPMDISAYEEIYVAGTQFPFTIYLLNRKIAFHYFEEAAGLLSQPEILRNNLKDRHPDHTAVADYYNLFHPEGPLIKSRIGNLKSQVPDYSDEKMVDFDVMQHFAQLSLNQQEKIKVFFGCPTMLDFPEQSVLILTQHLANLGVLDFEKQVLLYQLFVDYFFEKRQIIFKPHPDDALYYELLFPHSHVIREKFPSELLPFLFKERPQTLATVSSTAISNLREHFEEIVELGIPFERHFKIVHAAYYALKCCISALSICHLYLYSPQKYLFKELLNTSEFSVAQIKINRSLSDSNVILIDGTDLEAIPSSKEIISLLDNFSNEQIACFINCETDFLFYDVDRKDLWKNIIPITITKSVREGEDYYSDTASETIYFYTLNKEIQRNMENFKDHKELMNSGITLNVLPISENEKKIKILEGILEATEKRLLFYINREKELLEYISAHTENTSDDII